LMKVPFEIRFGNGAGESGVTRSPGRSDKGAAVIIEGPRAPPSLTMHPEVKWAERKDVLLVTIVCPDAKDPVIEILPEGKLTFSAKSGDSTLAFDLELNGEVDPEKTTKAVTARQIELKIPKKTEGFWGKLWKCPKKPQYIAVDWSRWVDEDDVRESEDLGGFGGMEGLGGMGGMGGMNFEEMMKNMPQDDMGPGDEEDEDEMPPLEAKGEEHN